MALTNPIVTFDAALSGLLKELPYNVRWRWAAEELTTRDLLPLIAIEYESFSEINDSSTERVVVKDLDTNTATIQDKFKSLSVRYTLHTYANKIVDIAEVEWAVRRKLDELETDTGVIVAQNQTMVLAPEKADDKKYYHAVMGIRATIYGVATAERITKLVTTRHFTFHDMTKEGMPEVDSYTVSEN